MDMTNLKQALDFAEYAGERERPFGINPAITPEIVLRKGIADLDFDPAYFLATGQTTPEEWATTK